MARYLLHFFAAFALAMATLAAINVGVDPNGVFRWGGVKGVNDQKTLKSDGGRVVKALLLHRHAFDVLCFGTSQGEVGLDPSAPEFGGGRGLNASLSYTNMFELSQAMEFAARHQRPRLVVVALDFVSFSGSEVTSGDFASSGFAGQSPWPAYAQRAISAQTLKDSFSVLRKSRRGERQFFAGNGRADPSVRPGYDHDKEFRSLLAAYLITEPETLPPARRRQSSFRTFQYQPQHVTRLMELARRFTDDGAQVLLFTAPVHAWYLETMIAAGQLPAYEQWKRDLAAGVAAANRGAARPIRLWDFGGYTPISTEAVPPAGTTTAMRWYWDPAHFTTEAGTLAVARMLGAAEPGWFGAELNPETVEGLLAAFRRGHEGYAAAGGFAPGAVASISAGTGARP